MDTQDRVESREEDEESKVTNGKGLEEDHLKKEEAAIEDEGEKSFWTLEYPIVAWLDNVSAWERFCHVKDPDTEKDMTIVTPNRKKYMPQFCHRIEKFGEWDDEKEIPVLAEKEFEKVDKEFAERYERVKDVPPHPAFPKVSLVDYHPHLKSHYSVLEYIPGCPFLSLTLGPFQMIRLMQDLFDGLAHMHKHGILHRRIKSENVYVHYEGSKPVVRFVSWGTAVLKEKAQNERSANGRGLYVAPEVLLDGAVTEQADIYSVAVLGYKALTGQFPGRERQMAKDLGELVNIVKTEKEPLRLSAYEHIRDLSQNERDILKLNDLDEFFFEILKRDPASRAIKSASAARNFLGKRWSQAMLKDTEKGHTFSVTVR